MWAPTISLLFQAPLKRWKPKKERGRTGQLEAAPGMSRSSAGHFEAAMPWTLVAPTGAIPCTPPRTGYLVDAGHHAGLVFALAAAHLIIATGNSTAGHDRCFHRCMLLLPSFVQSSLIAVPHPFLILTWLPSSPFHCSACFANTGCCCRNSGSCDGASWVRAPGVPRPHSRRLLHLLDLLH